MRAATTLYSGVTVEMNFQAARFPTKLLVPLWLGFLTYLVIFLYLHSLAYAPFPQELFGN